MERWDGCRPSVIGCIINRQITRFILLRFVLSFYRINFFSLFLENFR